MKKVDLATDLRTDLTFAHGLERAVLQLIQTLDGIRRGRKRVGDDIEPGSAKPTPIAVIVSLLSPLSAHARSAAQDRRVHVLETGPSGAGGGGGGQGCHTRVEKETASRGHSDSCP